MPQRWRGRDRNRSSHSNYLPQRVLSLSSEAPRERQNPNAAALRNRRCRCRSNSPTPNRSRSAVRALGHSSPASSDTVARNIRRISSTRAAPNGRLPRRRSSSHVNPSAAAAHHTVPPRRFSPHTTHWPSSGIHPSRRLIHRQKYTAGSHTRPTWTSGRTAPISRKIASSTASSGKASSSTSAISCSAAVRSQSIASESGDHNISNASIRTSSCFGRSAYVARTTVRGSSAPPNLRRDRMACRATPFTRPWSRVNRLTSRSASRKGHVLSTIASPAC